MQHCSAAEVALPKTTVSNDVIGLVPAFLYSGAASTVSTLWLFADEGAATYTEYFYSDFEAILKCGQKVVVDLGKANQKAILAIMAGEPALDHWALFVLTGYWMYELDGGGV